MMDCRENTDTASNNCPMSKIPGSVVVDMEHFMNSEKYSDIDVKVGDEVFKCHKIILASWSSYFDALFMSDMIEVKQGIVQLTAIEKEDFQHILKVMYTGKCEINADNIQGLLYSASYLQILPLIESCEKFVKKALSLEDKRSTLHYLQISRQFNLIQLSEHIIDHIAINFSIYEDCDNILESLSFDDMKGLFVSEKICWKSEEEICTTVLSWIDVDCSGRQRYAKDLVRKIRYLALSNEYMKDIFLEHKAIKGNEDCDEVRNNCLEYLSAPVLQSDYIGEPNASQRIGHRRRDVIAVFFQNCVKLLACLEKKDGSLEFLYSFDMSSFMEENLNRPEDRNEEGISVCSYGRSEVLLSNGNRLFHFNGLTWIWTTGPKHNVQSSINCILCNKSAGDIYNIVVSADIVFIEKCKFDHVNGFDNWEIEFQQYIGNSSYMYDQQSRTFLDKNLTTFQGRDKTCAYMVGDNIFFIRASGDPEGECATLCKYDTKAKVISIVDTLQLKYQGATVMTHKGLIFLIDGRGQTIYSICEEGHCEKSGMIGVDFPDGDHELNKYSGSCLFKGNVIRVKDFNCKGGKSGAARVLSYDLSQHVTKIHKVDNFMYPRNAKDNAPNAVCIKLTMLPHFCV